MKPAALGYAAPGPLSAVHVVCSQLHRCTDSSDQGESDTALASAPCGLSAPITQECVSAPGRLTGPLLPSHVRVYFPFGRLYAPLSGDSAVRLCALEAHMSRDECLGEGASTLPLPALAGTPGPLCHVSGGWTGGSSS